MKYFSLLLLISTFTFAQNYQQYVNPMIGTGGHGHTFPGATVPFGMVQLSPDTRIDGSRKNKHPNSMPNPRLQEDRL